MNTTRRFAIGGATILLLSIGSTTSSSAFESGSHGSVCTARPGDKDKVDFSSARGAYNKSTTSTAQIYCTVDADDTSNWQQVARRFDVAYIDNSSGDIKCTLFFQDFLGNTVFSTPLNSSGTSTSVRTMTWSASPPTSQIQYWWIHLSCQLPAWSGSGPEPQIRGFTFGAD